VVHGPIFSKGSKSKGGKSGGKSKGWKSSKSAGSKSSKAFSKAKSTKSAKSKSAKKRLFPEMTFNHTLWMDAFDNARDGSDESKLSLLQSNTEYASAEEEFELPRSSAIHTGESWSGIVALVVYAAAVLF